MSKASYHETCWVFAISGAVISDQNRWAQTETALDRLPYTTMGSARAIEPSKGPYLALRALHREHGMSLERVIALMSQQSASIIG